MPIRTFDFCALQFLNQWLEKESNFCESLASDLLEKQRTALVGAAAHFRIARNLPTKYERAKNLQRYQPIIEVLNDLGEVTPENVEGVVNETHQAISAHYGSRRVLSLVTKFLWLKVKAPVRIYDSQARIALGAQEGDFRSFNAKFSARFSKCAEEIDQACANLKNVVSYTVNPAMTDSEVDTLVNQHWFKERVLDIYLWNEGNT